MHFSFFKGWAHILNALTRIIRIYLIVRNLTYVHTCIRTRWPLNSCSLTCVADVNICRYSTSTEFNYNNIYLVNLTHICLSCREPDSCFNVYLVDPSTFIQLRSCNHWTVINNGTLNTVIIEDIESLTVVWSTELYDCYLWDSCLWRVSIEAATSILVCSHVIYHMFWSDYTIWLTKHVLLQVVRNTAVGAFPLPLIE